MAQELESLRAQVAATDTVIASAVLLIQGFSAQLAAAGTDPNALEALRVDLAAQTSALAHAVAANTVQAPVVAPVVASPVVEAPAPVAV